MSHLKIIALMTLAIFNASSQAIDLPHWERPVLQAILLERPSSAKGDMQLFEEPKVQLIMNQKQGSRNATSFDFIEEIPNCWDGYCLPVEPIETHFLVSDAYEDGCGSTIYHAVELSKNGGVHQLVVVDHSNRICEDYRPYQWEVQITDNAFIPNNRSFSGNPEPVYTIMNQD